MPASEGHTYPAPLKKTGVLDSKFKFEETTPIIGREYPEANIVEDILNAQDADALLRDLAITSTLNTHIYTHLSLSKRHSLIKRKQSPSAA